MNISRLLKGTKWTLAGLWRWSLLATIPITLIGIYWAGQTYTRYAEFGLRHNSFPFTADLHAIGAAELESLKSRAKVALATRQLPAQIRTVDMFVAESDIKKLDSSLPESGREYVKAYLLYPSGKGYRVDLRYRGDFVHHWGHEKKSLRIKTRKNRLYEGMRKFNLIVPKFAEMLNNHLAYRLAGQLGLIAPHSEMVHLRINGTFKGLFVLVEQIEESTLRAQGRMPGDIYSGEMVGRDRYTGTANILTDSPYYWQKESVNNHYEESSIEPLKAFLKAINNGAGPGPDDEHLWRHIDLDKWARFFAFETLAQTFHYSPAHNWRLYYDPWKQTIEPIVWDPDGWHPQWRRTLAGKVRLDIVTSNIHRALHRNQAIKLRRDRILREFFARDQHLDFLARARQLADTTVQTLSLDPYNFWNFRHLTPDVTFRSVRRLIQAIGDTFENVETQVASARGDTVWSWQDNSPRLTVQTSSPSGRNTIALRSESTFPTLQKVVMKTAVGSRWVERDITDAVVSRPGEIEIRVSILPAYDRVSAGLRWPLDESVPYRPGHAVFEFTPDITDLVAQVSTGGFEGADLAVKIAPSDHTFRPYLQGTVLAPPEMARKLLRWSGIVPINGTVRIDQDLQIEPGTKLVFGPAASLIVYGQVTAVGTEAAPITFLSESPGERWGAFAIQGDGASGSRFVNCEFDGGSGLKLPLEEYSAMFSVHGARDVVIDSCTFRNGTIYDDTLHAVYSDLALTDSQFLSAFSDAVDLDMSTATVSGSTFELSGNDGLDLMGATVGVTDSLFESNGDKGISVGERSQIFVLNSIFINNLTGAEVKDDSAAVLANSEFRANKTAVRAYNKNWRYGAGGSALVTKSTFFENEAALDIQSRSQAHLYDSYVDSVVQPGKRLSVSPPSQGHVSRASWPQNKKPESTLAAMPRELSKYWLELDPQRRGVE